MASQTGGQAGSRLHTTRVTALSTYRVDRLVLLHDPEQRHKEARGGIGFPGAKSRLCGRSCRGIVRKGGLDRGKNLVDRRGFVHAAR